MAKMFLGRPITGRLAVRFLLSLLKKIGKTDSWRGVHLFATTKVPLSKAPYPHAPVYGICLYECVTLCMCMCVFNRCQPGWVKSGGEILCISLYMMINLILIFIIHFSLFSALSWLHSRQGATNNQFLAGRRWIHHQAP